MTDNIALELTFDWIKAQHTRIESEIAQLKAELDRKKREYDEFTSLLSRLQEENLPTKKLINSPKKWLRREYQTRPIEENIFHLLKRYQPAKPSELALILYEIDENSQYFPRIRNLVNAVLVHGRKQKKWKTIEKGVYVLNDYPKSFNPTIVGGSVTRRGASG